jgi:hypothetical protein
MGARHISRLLWTFAAQEGMGALDKLSCCYKIPCGLCCLETMSNKTTWSMIQRPSSNSAQDDKRPWSQARSVEPLQP